MSKKILILLLLLSYFLYPQKKSDKKEKEKIIRQTMDQSISFGLGVFLPLFFENPKPLGGESRYFNVMKNGNMTPGISINFRYGFFLTSGLNIGLEANPNIAFGSNKDIVFMLFAGPKLEYYFRSYPLEFPLRISMGIAIMQYKNLSNAAFYLRPGLSMIWDVYKEWAVGLNVDYTFVPQIYYGKNIPKEQTRLGNFLSIYLSLEYTMSKK